MPTENRSSNTEMVSVTRYLAEEINAALINHGHVALPRRLQEAMNATCPQPHPEPIAWMVGTAFWWTKEEAERDAVAVGLPVIAVGPIANPEEVQRLVAANTEYARRHLELNAEVERLRAALRFYADREHYHFESGNWDTVSGEPLNILWCGEEPDFIEDGTVARNALSASAEPSAPKCTYCGDTGQIMVGRSGDTNDGNAPIMEPCEDCDGSGSSGGQMHSNGMDEPEYEPFKCETCDGFGSVPDGEITGAGGVEFESGPIQCVKDCPDCKPSAPVDRDERALIELALSEYGKATGKHVLPGGINENQDGFVHGFLVRAALERKPS